MGSHPTADAGLVPLERMIGSLLLVGGALFVVRPWNGTLSLHTVSAVLGCLLVVAAGVVIRNCTWTFEQFEHAHLSAGLAAMFALFAAVPLLAQLGNAFAVIVCAGAAAVVLVASAGVRKATIDAVAVRVDARTHEAGEIIDVPLTTHGRLSVVPHAFALFFAWLASCVVMHGTPTARTICASIVYLATLAVWTRSIARSATDVGAWQREMRERGQTFVPTPARRSLEEALSFARRRIVAFELATAAAVVAAGTVAALQPPTSAVDSLPVGMATIFATITILDLGRPFLRSVRSTLTGANTLVVGDPGSDDLADTGVYAVETVRYLAKRMAFVGVAIGVVGKVMTALHAWPKIQSGFEWVTNLLG